VVFSFYSPARGERPLWAFPYGIYLVPGGSAMSVHTIFCLNGVGYLHDVYQKDGGLYARINVIHQFNSGSQHSDDVWIDCIVNDHDLLQLMNGLRLNLGMQKTIIIQFSIAFSGFDYCQAGTTEEGPNYIVFFKGRLQRVEKCFVNGVGLNEQRPTQQAILNSMSK
jgi:hypothetical protein